MATEYRSIPFAVDLSRERGWIPSSEVERWGIVRFHCALDEHAVAKTKPRMGDRISVHYAEDSQIDLVRSISVDMERVKVTESIHEAVFTEELMTSISASLGIGAKGPGSAEAKGEASRSISQKIEQVTRSIDRVEETQTERRQETFEVKYNFDFKPGMSVVNVAMYERRAIDLYLVWMDYLEVEYERTTFRLRKRRVKHPAFEEGGRVRRNEVQLRLPIGSFQYWRLLPHSSVMIREENYRNPIRDTTSIRRSNIAKPRLFERKSYPSVPSLYQLSNAAFPLKWADRRGDWTYDQLCEIEHEEAKGSVWWFQNGPGSVRRARKRNTNGNDPPPGLSQ